MSIVKSVVKAYQVMKSRNWDTVYWAVDLHGVCLKSNYKTNSYEWINESAKRALQLISSLPESKIILWSSVHIEEIGKILCFFRDSDIKVCDFNSNRFEKNNDVSCFDEKFYFSVLLDDKAGFDPDEDWDAIARYLRAKQLVKEQTEMKPVVFYTETGLIEVGFGASVKVVDHEEADAHNEWVSTSSVVSHDPVTGVFETRNTIYKPNILLG